jgi:putative ABC transport system permease protein
MPFDALGKTPQEQQEAGVNLVSPEYFPTLKISMLSGRLWTQGEVMEGAKLAIVNETFARRYFPNEDVIGRSVKFPRFAAPPPSAYAANGSDGWLEIVGVVKDAVNDGLDKPIAPAVYVPYTLIVWNGTQIVVRTQGNPLAMLPSIRKQIASLNASQGMWWQVHDLEEIIRREPEYARTQLFSILLGAFAGLALLLAAMGLYSVVSYSVAQRTGELGVRIALGAGRGHILATVFRSIILSVGGGILFGVALTLALSRLLAQWTSGTTDARDPLLLAVSALVLVLAALLASGIPAHRAANLDPMSAIRAE